MESFFQIFKNYKAFLNADGRMDTKYYKKFNNYKLIDNPILKTFISDCNLIYFGIRGNRNENPTDKNNPGKDNAPDFDILGRKNEKYELKFLNFFDKSGQEIIIKYIIKYLNSQYKKTKAEYKKITNRKYKDLLYYKNDSIFENAVKKGQNVILESTGDVYEQNGKLIPSLRWFLDKYGKQMIEKNYHVILTVPFVSSIEELRKRNISRFIEKYDNFLKNRKENIPPRFPYIDDKMRCSVKRIYDNYRKTLQNDIIEVDILFIKIYMIRKRVNLLRYF